MSSLAQQLSALAEGAAALSGELDLDKVLAELDDAVAAARRASAALADAADRLAEAGTDAVA